VSRLHLFETRVAGIFKIEAGTFKIQWWTQAGEGRVKNSAPAQSTQEIPAWSVGLEPDDRLEAAMSAKPRSGAAKDRTPIATFDFFDTNNTLLYQKLKYDSEPKYGQRRPDGNGGWIGNLNGVKRVLYRLPELTARKSATVFACEGEGDADNVAALGLCATSADSGTWKPDLIEPLRGCDVVILPDFDSTGVKRALEAANALHGVAASIRMIFLPGLTGAKGNKDVSDWLDQDPKRADIFVETCLNAPLWTPDSDVEGLTEAAKVRTRKPDDDDNRPSITVKAGTIPAMATQAEEFLIAAGVPLYQRAESLVRPIVEAVDASHGRKTAVARLKILDAPYLRDLLARHVNWQRYDRRSDGMVETDPPLNVIATMLARTGDWKVPPVSGIVSTPTMRPDGSLLIESGYDAATRLLLIAPPEMPAIPKNPTRKDALAALDLLKGLLPEFPFIDDVARAVALSAIISPVVRGAFPVTPMHVARAPTSGSGKSYLWDIVAAIVIGQLMPVMAAGRNEEETEKRLAAALVSAQVLINIDNVNGELGGDALCQAIERPNIRIRILGKTEQVHIEARGTSTFASGNNIIIVGDVCRRVITTTLDPQLERPELREFHNDPIATVLENRGAYIAACLTICRAYIVAGRPAPARKLASFEGWSNTVRSALIWLGEADCVDSIEISREEDPEISDLRNLLTAWAEEVGLGYRYRVTVTNALEMAAQMVATGYSGESPKYPNLQAAVQTVAARGKYTDAKLFGNWLRRRKGRIVSGKYLRVMTNPKGGSMWWVESISGRQNGTREEEESREEEEGD
jgi:hypothetical protein